MGLNKLALKAEESIKRSGGMPQIFGTITVSDGISMGTEGMKYSLVSREVIADSIETACNAQSMDGVLAIGGVIADDLSLFILFVNLFYSIAPTLQVASSHQQLQN